MLDILKILLKCGGLFYPGQRSRSNITLIFIYILNFDIKKGQPLKVQNISTFTSGLFYRKPKVSLTPSNSIKQFVMTL